MVDMNLPIYHLLKDIASVELEFPDKFSEFPVITIAEVSNPSGVIYEGKELNSAVTYQVDVWDNGESRQECERIASEVSKRLIANNFTRPMSRGLKDPSGLHRKTMYFKINIIEKGVF